MPTDWSELRHAYGSAEDVPENLRALRSDDEEVRHEALGELFASIVHQGSRYAASAAAALAVRLTGADAFDACLARLRQVRAEPALTVVTEALRLAFPDGPVPGGTPFGALTDRQQRLARVLAASPASWLHGDVGFGNFAWAVRDHGLPGSPGEMAAYVR